MFACVFAFVFDVCCFFALAVDLCCHCVVESVFVSMLSCVCMFSLLRVCL